MRKFVIAGVAFATLFVSPAFAADMAVKAPVYTPPAAPTWTGFYIGANGGYGWSQSSTTANPFQNFTSTTPVIPPFGISQQLSGALAGVQLGYNYQIAPTWVIGVEGDFDGAGLNNSAQAIALDPLAGSGGTATDGLMVHEDIQWLATARARLGYTWGPGMLYATGGGAWEGVKDNYLLSTDTSGGTFSQSAGASVTSTRSGWVAGGGVEWMINPNWIARLEYLHYGFNNSSSAASIPVTCTVGGTTATCGSNATSSNNGIDAVRVGLSYRFGR